MSEPRTFVRLEARDEDDVTTTAGPLGAHGTNYTILMTHIALKGAQAGSLIGPIYAVLRYRRNLTVQALLRSTIAWTAYTSVGASLMGVARAWQLSHVEIYDRAYRLNHNLTQNRCDALSLSGVGIGSILGLVLFRRPTVSLYTRIAGGATLGLATGVLAHMGSSALIANTRQQKVPTTVV